MGNSTLKEAHGRTLFRNREVFPARNKSRREVEGVSGTESEDRDDVEHYRELRRGCGEGVQKRLKISGAWWKTLERWWRCELLASTKRGRIIGSASAKGQR